MSVGGLVAFEPRILKCNASSSFALPKLHATSTIPQSPAIYLSDLSVYKSSRAGSGRAVAPVMNCDSSSSRRQKQSRSMSDLATGLTQFPAGGGAPELLTRLDFEKGEANHLSPHVLSDGASTHAL